MAVRRWSWGFPEEFWDEVSEVLEESADCYVAPFIPPTERQLFEGLVTSPIVPQNFQKPLHLHGMRLESPMYYQPVTFCGKRGNRLANMSSWPWHPDYFCCWRVTRWQASWPVWFEGVEPGIIHWDVPVVTFYAVAGDFQRGLGWLLGREYLGGSYDDSSVVDIPLLSARAEIDREQWGRTARMIRDGSVWRSGAQIVQADLGPASNPNRGSLPRDVAGYMSLDDYSRLVRGLNQVTADVGGFLVEL